MKLFLPLLALLFWRASSEAMPFGSSEGLAESHEHWEHIVRKRTVDSLFDTYQVDEASHIVNVQEYYKDTFEQGWEEYDDKKQLLELLRTYQQMLARGQGYNEASIQDASHTLEVSVDSKPIPGRFLVMLQSSADDYALDRTVEVLAEANAQSGQKIRASDIQKLRHVGKGFVATMNRKTVDLLERHPLVEHIEEDTAVRRSSIDLGRVSRESAEAQDKKEVTWNLDRLDQRDAKLDGVFKPEGTGKNVKIYVIDTGVMANHQEFGDRVHYAGFDAVDHMTGSNNKGRDCNGHGTHCAGTAAGKTYGVAKEAEIYNLRALNCQGTGAVSGIVMGIDKIVEHHKNNHNEKPAVITQSLGVKTSTSLNRAVQAATDAGITMVGAAGNQAEYSCDHSPASAQVGISVGATDKQDTVTMFTNTGKCTDIMAPGSDIKSASIECDTCTKTMSGTSMAAPHAAGYAAIILEIHPQMSAVDVKNRMMNVATKGVKMSNQVASRQHAKETPDRLLYVPSATAKDSDLKLDMADLNSQWE